MSITVARANADAELAALPMRATEPLALGAGAPALSVALVALGVAVTAAAFEAGYEAGHGGDPRPGAN